MAAAELSLAEDVAACLEKFLEHIQPIPARVQGGLGRVRQLDEDSVGVLHRVAALEEKYLAHTRKQAQKRRGSVLIDIKDAKRCRRRLAEIETERNTAVLMAAEKIQLTTQLYELVDARIQQLDVRLKQFEGTLRKARGEVSPKASKKGRHGSRKRDRMGEVAYGGMVACDNDDCPTEWFHFACVGLKETPPGAWRCAECRAADARKAAKKKKRRRGRRR